MKKGQFAQLEKLAQRRKSRTGRKSLGRSPPARLSLGQQVARSGKPGAQPLGTVNQTAFELRIGAAPGTQTFVGQLGERHFRELPVGLYRPACRYRRGLGWDAERIQQLL